MRRFSSLCVITGLLSACGGEAPPAPPLLEVTVFELEPRTVPLYIEAVGQTRGSVDIPIRARVDGVLEEIHFLEGRSVEKGQLLYVIDSQPFRARLVEAEGGLAQARTGLAKAKSDLERIRPLAEMDAVSQQDLDGAVAQYEAAQGAVQAAEAQVEQAEIELGYTRIKAPVDGLIGITQAKVGEYVGRSPNPVVLNVVSQTDPIRVRFAINEREYLRFRRDLGASLRDMDGRAEGERVLDLILADGTVHRHKGYIVNFDAYAYFDRFILYGDPIRAFLAAGGMLAWGIVPTLEPETIRQETVDTLYARWQAQFRQIEALGIAPATLFARSFITPSCGVGSLSLDLAKRVLALTRDLSATIRDRF